MTIHLEGQTPEGLRIERVEKITKGTGTHTCCACHADLMQRKFKLQCRLDPLRTKHFILCPQCWTNPPPEFLPAIRDWKHHGDFRCRRGEGMPTPPPADMAEPKSPEERMERLGAVTMIRRLHAALYDLSYGTRSHMPVLLDWTDFIDAITKMKKFCEARPDWALHVVKKVFGPPDQFMTDHWVQLKLWLEANDQPASTISKYTLLEQMNEIESGRT